MEVTNNHFKKLINEYSLDECFENFAVEFQYGTFLIPVQCIDEKSCIFAEYSIDGKSVYPLFTDYDEYIEYNFSEDNEKLMEVTYKTFKRQYENHEYFGGFVINPGTTEFEITPDECFSLINYPIIEVDTTHMINYPLEKFTKFVKKINKEQAHVINDDLLDFVLNTFLFTFVEFDENPTFDDDFFNVSNNSKFIFTTCVNREGIYVPVYTSFEEMKQTKENYDRDIYGQLINFKFLIDNILYNDWDGIILNMESEEPLLIHRYFLIMNINKIGIQCNYGKLKNSYNYAFKI